MTKSLRQTKKIATKLAIYEAAYKLFNSKGYSKTKLSDIAEMANVSQRTIFAYFPSKEAIIFEKHRQVIDSLFKHIQERHNQTVLQAIRSFGTYKESHQVTKKDEELVNNNPELQEYLHQFNASVENKLVSLIAAENNLPGDSIQALLIAASARTMIAYSMNNKSDTESFEIGLKFIEAGLNATKKQG